GASNLQRHLANVAGFGLKAVVAVNRFPDDTRDEVETVRRLALQAGAHAAELNDGFERGGAGASDLAEAVVDAAEQASSFEHTYPLDATIGAKIDAIARKVYGADGISLAPPAEEAVALFAAQGLAKLPICLQTI